MDLIDRKQPAPMNHIFRFYEFKDYLRAAAESGYESIDLWTCGAHYFVDAHTHEETKSLKRMLGDYGLKAVSIVTIANHGIQSIHHLIGKHTGDT